MATTDPLKTERSVAAAKLVACVVQRRAWLVLWTALGSATPAMAERWQVETAVSSQAQWTSNSDFGLSALSRDDTILEVHPRITLKGEGARLHLSGTAGLDAIAYAKHTQDSRALPSADLNARLEAIERLFFVETGYRASQASQDPFLVRPDTGTTSNTVTTTQVRFSPIIEGTAAGDLHYTLRADNSWVREIGGVGPTTAAGYFGHSAAAIEQPARPFGWRLDAERSYTRYKDETQPSVDLSQARVGVSYALLEDLRVGLRAGSESENLVNASERHRTSGAEVQWNPSPRTTLVASRDKRFFGAAWNLVFTHRLPMVALRVDLSRNIDTTPQALADLPATANVAALLDAMFTTRFPDPLERARVVQDLIDRNGLPTSTLGPIALLSNRVSLVTRRGLSVVFNGVRNSLTLAAFNLRTEDAVGNSPLTTGTAFGNNVQRGASVALNHRLTSLVALNIGLDWTRIRALEGVGTDATTQRDAKVQVSVQASPKTNAFLGGRYRNIDSNVVPQGREGSVFVGLDHRF